MIGTLSLGGPILAAIAALAAVAPPSAGSRASASVPCDKIILRVGPRHAGYRLVLDAIQVPAAHLPQIVASANPEWPFWRKVGLVIRGGSPPVSVSVARSLRNRAAITWGNTGPVSSLRIASCPPLEAKPWNAYAGGFFLRSRSACVPLVFRVGGRSTTVRFGLGRPCAPAAG